MKIHISEIIKKYRKEYGFTQEELASKLGVSLQAVSRWETGSTFPDISLLPDIAGVFEISVDELLGVKSKNNDKIKEIIDNANSYYNESVEKVVECLENAKKKYPNNIDITLNLIYALSVMPSTDIKGVNKRVIELCEKIIDNVSEMQEKSKLYHTLVYAYLEIGDAERAKNYASKLPSMEECFELVTASLTKDNPEFIQNNIQELTRILITQMSLLIDTSYYTINEKITILKKIEPLIKLIYENNDYIYFNWLVFNTYLDLSRLYALKKDKENTLYYLKGSLNYIKNSSGNKSLLNNKINKDFSDVFCGDFLQIQKNNFLDTVNNKIFDFLRESTEFKQMEEGIKSGIHKQ